MAKATTREQHILLHQVWPSDCCLCGREVIIEGLKEEIKKLEDEILECGSAFHKASPTGRITK